MTAQARLLLSGGLVVDPASGTVDRKDLLIEDGRLAWIGTTGATPARSATRRDVSDRLIVPGLVNSHTHGHANLMKGIAERWTLEASLTNGPWLAGPRDPETIYLSTLVGAIDMLTKGCKPVSISSTSFRGRPWKASRRWRAPTPMPGCAPRSRR